MDDGGGRGEVTEREGSLSFGSGRQAKISALLAIAAAIDGVNSELLNGIMTAHPQLEKEIDSDMKKFGRFL